MISQFKVIMDNIKTPSIYNVLLIFNYFEGIQSNSKQIGGTTSPYMQTLSIPNLSAPCLCGSLFGGSAIRQVMLKELYKLRRVHTICPKR